MSKPINEIIDTMNEEQKDALYTMLSAALEKGDDVMAHSGLNKEEVATIFSDAVKIGSLKDSILAHAEEFGITNIEELFPDYKTTTGKPGFINNNVEWVNKVLTKVGKLPFARVKNMHADISKESVRAKGYIKGDLKEEDVFMLLTRTTDPVTIYKKQKLDRDDVVDTSDFDLVAWIKEVIRMKLDEEIARAILIGDGRDTSDRHKIPEDNIRPIVNDSDLYAIKVAIGAEENREKAFINACVRSRKDYRGSGTPTLFTTEDKISEILLMEDSIGNRIYKTIEEIKAVLRVSDIVTINEMAGLVRPTEDGKTHNVVGIIVNLSDYLVGMDKGGKVSMFDDFDIDYNQMKYLIETRCSGALVTPYSAMIIEDVVDTLKTTALNEEGAGTDTDGTDGTPLE